MRESSEINEKPAWYDRLPGRFQTYLQVPELKRNKDFSHEKDE
jgi:hypothetical protein